MISYIRGELCDIEKDKAVVDVCGVGYGIYMPNSSLSALPPCGSEVKVYTYMNVREDAVQLFGFLSKDDLYIFRNIISVSGIGPKGGLAVLSVMTADEFRIAVLSKDVKAITAAPGIGKKTAEKLILELKDKFNADDVLLKGSGGGDDGRGKDEGLHSAQSEAVQALVALGYTSAQSFKAVRGVELENPSVEEILKEALKKIF